jgi:hypothetical protein
MTSEVGFGSVLRRGMHLAAEALEDDLAPGTAALDERVNPLQVGGVDGRVSLRRRGAQRPCVHQARDLIEQDTLLGHVDRLVDRAGEHQLPMD